MMNLSAATNLPRFGLIVAAATSVFMSMNASTAQEVIVRKGWLPFGLAGVEQTLTFHPSEEDYNSVRDETLKKLSAGEPIVNLADGPWVQIETTATVGVEIEGIGSSSGRTSFRQITAIEDALYRFEESN